MKNALIAVLCVLASSLLLSQTAQASCTATVNCEVTVIQCSGSSACHSGTNWVQCDSQATIYCPVCQAQVTCCDGSFIYCNGYTSCQQYPRRVVCDGQIGGICPLCPDTQSQMPSFFQKEAAVSTPAE